MNSISLSEKKHEINLKKKTFDLLWKFSLELRCYYSKNIFIQKSLSALLFDHELDFRKNRS